MAGADANAVRKDGCTPLHCAATNDSRLTAVTLLVCGAAVSLDEDGRTPADVARQRNHPELAALLDAWATRDPRAATALAA